MFTNDTVHDPSVDRRPIAVLSKQQEAPGQSLNCSSNANRRRLDLQELLGFGKSWVESPCLTITFCSDEAPASRLGGNASSTTLLTLNAKQPTGEFAVESQHECLAAQAEILLQLECK